MSPDPILASPAKIVLRAMEGRSTPTYGYADNNPIAFTDPEGLESQNNDELPVVVKLEGEGYVILLSGEHDSAPQDGVYVSTGSTTEVTKTVSGTDVIVNADGTTTVTTDTIKEAGGQAIVDMGGIGIPGLGPVPGTPDSPRDQTGNGVDQDFFVRHGDWLTPAEAHLIIKAATEQQICFDPRAGTP